MLKLVMKINRTSFFLFFLFSITNFLSMSVTGFEKYTGHGGPVKSLAISEDEKFIVSTSFDYTAVIWKMPEVKEIARLVGHDGAVNVAAFSPNTEWLATAGDDNNIFLWSLLEDTQRKSQYSVHSVGSSHTAKIVSISFSSTGEELVSSSWDGSSIIWEVPEMEPKKIIRGHKGAINASDFAYLDRELITAGRDGQIKRWKTDTGEYLGSFVRNGWSINVMDINPETNLIAYGTSDGLMRVIDIESGDEKVRFFEEGVPILSLSISNDSKRAAFGDARGKVLVADINNGALLHDFAAAFGPVWGLAISNRDDEFIYISGLDDFFSRWELGEFSWQHYNENKKVRRFHVEDQFDNGARQFARKCSVCHTLVEDGKRRAGPTLFKIFGRKVGALRDYPYSRALRDSNFEWNESSINELFRVGPDVMTPGTKMPIQRIKKSQDRIDLVDFLKRATSG